MKRRYYLAIVLVGLALGVVQFFYRTYTVRLPDCSDCQGSYQVLSRGSPFHIVESSDRHILLYINLVFWVLAFIFVAYVLGIVIKHKKI